MLTRDEIAGQALMLPREDRLHIADLLYESLSTFGGFATPEIEKAWMEEIQRRIDAVDRGEMPTENWEVVIARLRARFESKVTDAEMK